MKLFNGDRAGARRDFRRTVDLYTGLAQSGPLVPQSIFKFASSNYHLGSLERDAGRAEGCKRLGRALELSDEYSRRAPPPYSAETSQALAKMRADANSCRVGLRN